MPHLIPPYLLQPPPAETPVLNYGRPESEGMPAAAQWVLGALLGLVVTFATGVFFAFFGSGGPINSTIAALLAPPILERSTKGLRRDPRLRHMKLAIRSGAVVGVLLNCWFLTRLTWG